MNIEDLKKYQETLEKKYEELDKKITEIEDEEEQKDEVAHLEFLQDRIDDQLDLIDDIIEGLHEVPRKYNELMGLKKEYESILGE